MVFIQFASLIIRGFGFDTFQTLLLGMPGPAISFVVLLIAAYITNKYRRMRCYVMASSLVLALMGIILVRELPYSNRGGRLVGIWLTFVFACGFPLSLSIISSNFAGYTKKTTVAAILFIGYCAGNIGGPMVFKANEAPHYEVSANPAISISQRGVPLVLITSMFCASPRTPLSSPASVSPS